MHDNKITAISMRVSSPEEQTLTVLQNGVETQYNMVQLLKFRDNIVGEMADHAANQSYWEQSAIDIEFNKLAFEESGYAIWWTHARRYARYYSKAKNLKETLEAVKDFVISLYSETVPEDEREILVSDCFQGFLLEKHGTQKAIDAAYSDVSSVFAADKQRFSEHMLMFLKEGWTYEKIEKTKRDLQEMSKRMNSFARTYGERAFKMKEVADHDLAKYGNSSANPLGRYNTTPSQSARADLYNDHPGLETGRSSSTEPNKSNPARVEPIKLKMFCGACGQLQYMSPGGITCPNGHGGSESVPDPFQPTVPITDTTLTRSELQAQQTTSKRRMNMPRETIAQTTSPTRR
jgi:hypothetical protein